MLDRNVGDHKDRFFSNILMAISCKNHISPLQDKDGHLTTRDRDKSELFDTFLSLFSSGMMDHRGLSALS